MTQRGQFITFEGSEGAGKSTNLTAALTCLQSHGIEPYVTREPGGTPMAEALRHVLLSDWQETVDGLSEALIVFAARRQHVVTEIRPRLEQGEWVLCDRFTDASYAYQGAARGVPQTQLASLEDWTHGLLQPDLTLYLDLDPDIGKARIADRALDRLEQEQQSFFAAVREGYLERAKKHARIRVIDASEALSLVQQSVISNIEAFVHQVIGGHA